MARARILIVVFGRVPNDAASSAETAASALRGDLDIVALRGAGQAHQGRLGDTRVFRVQSGGVEPFVRAVQRQLEAERYDAVHLCGPEGALAEGLPATVVYDASHVHADEGWVQRHHAALAAAGHVIVPTAAAKDTLQRKTGASVLHLAPGVPLDRFDFDDSPHRERALRVLCLDAGRPARDLECVLAAARLLKGPFHILLAGVDDAGARLALRRRVEALGLSLSVTVRGTPHPGATAGLIAGSDVGLSPLAAHDAFVHAALLPEPLLEFWAGRCPVVAPDFAGLRALSGPGDDLLPYAAGDPGSLARALLHASEREGAGNTAYGWVRASRGITGRERALRTLYERLLPGSQFTDAWTDGFASGSTGTFISMPGAGTDSGSADALEGAATRVETLSD